MNALQIKKILVPVDFSDTSMKAFDHAISMARSENSEIILLNVVEKNFATASPAGFDYEPILKDVLDDEKNILNKSNELLIKLSENIKNKGALKVKIIATIGQTHSEIVETAKNEHVDIIIMGTHGASGFREFTIGSNAAKVMNDAECPVLTIRHHSKVQEFKNIVVPFRDKNHSRESILPAIAIAKIYDATIHLLGIDTEHTPEHMEIIKEELEQSKKLIEKHNVKCIEKCISGQYDSLTIMKYAKSVNADLIVSIADMDKMSISEFIMGPYSKQIINHSPIPVLSIRPEFNPVDAENSFPGFNWNL